MGLQLPSSSATLTFRNSAFYERAGASDAWRTRPGAGPMCGARQRGVSGVVGGYWTFCLDWSCPSEQCSSLCPSVFQCIFSLSLLPPKGGHFRFLFSYFPPAIKFNATDILCVCLRIIVLCGPSTLIIYLAFQELLFP